MNRRAIAALAGLVVAAFASSSAAFVREDSNWDPSRLPATYSINLSTAPSEIGSSGAQSAVEAGFTSWAGPTCTSWRATDLGNTTRSANASDRANTILWVSGSWPASLGDVNSVIGVTTPVWTTGGYFIDADIQFNNVGFTWSLNGASGTVDTQSIATHEEGHFLGLGHPPVPAAIMYASYSGGQKRVLNSDDVSGVCAIYPSGSAPPPTDAGTPTTGTGVTGSPCNSGTDCASSICVSDGTNSFCSARCTDDCGCPTGFSCFSTTTAGVQVCAPGANACSTGHDSGTTPPPTGTGMLGDPCMTGSQCQSSFCAHALGASTGFCTRACADDTTCPCGYQCFPTTDGPMVCGPGENICNRDAGITPVGDAGAVLRDAAPTTDTGTAAPNPGCGCSVPGGRESNVRFALFASLLALAVTARRRRH